MSIKEVLLCSAGADSFPVWRYLDKPPALYCDLEYRYRQQEQAAITTLTYR